jgi:monoamine oxidase
MAIPFSILRNLDLRRSGFSARKLQAITTLGMGTNAKLAVQFTDRVWNSLGSNGETYSDRGYQNTWEATRAQPGRSGILVNFVGGSVGTAYGAGTTNDRAKTFLGQVEPVLPGLSAAWNGRALRDWWPGDPYTKGSYSYWRVGQYTTIAGAEREVDGGCHFAGEHTSIDFQGYLNGAVETGQRAAGEILALLK